ncbi:MAG TPA: hypothetical protein VEA41_14515 [Salinarimonas sp.]|nr:hypothetical protein [Salinarimonas sp.]
MKTVMLAAVLALVSPAASAQAPASPPSNASANPSPGNAGLGPAGGHQERVTVPERGALPAAQTAAPSAAPGAKIDCQAQPAQCSEPVTTTGAVGPSPGVPTQSK